MDKDEALIIVMRYLDTARAAGFKVAGAYLFGSTARGTGTADSDIDVAILIEGLDDAFEAQVALMQLRRSIDLRIEPHPFSVLDLRNATPFLAEVLRTGIKVA